MRIGNGMLLVCWRLQQDAVELARRAAAVNLPVGAVEIPLQLTPLFFGHAARRWARRWTFISRTRLFATEVPAAAALKIALTSFRILSLAALRERRVAPITVRVAPVTGVGKHRHHRCRQSQNHE